MGKGNSDDSRPVSHEMCPWWLCFTFDNFIRRALQNPTKIVQPYLKEGYKVLDVGPGMGYFTIPMAKLVGESGQVIAADLQPHMLDAIKRRATRAGIQSRIKLHLASLERIGVTEPVDFALAFWMVHEVPDQVHLLKEIAGTLKPQGQFLLAEPVLHVSGPAFAKSVNIAQEVGLSIVDKPRIFISNAVLFNRLS
jgi:ubiquinone/menaquinone biosynthesis C-methylase UbiE